MEMVNGEPHDDVNGQLRAMCEGNGTPPPAIAEESVRAIRRMIAELIGRWHELAPGESMELAY